jgi:hypothetical protein
LIVCQLLLRVRSIMQLILYDLEAFFLIID